MQLETIKRESSFELLRIIAQYMIIIYHIFLYWFVNNGSSVHPEIFKAIWIPMHVAVPLYVLISGYFGIHFSIKGLLRIISMLFVYGLIPYILNVVGVIDEVPPELKLRKLFFVSNTNNWFIRTYLFLYLLAPIVNKTNASISSQTRILLLLLWINCFVGWMEFDMSLHEGKCICYFVLMYLLGNSVKTYKNTIDTIPNLKVLLLYLLINVISIGGYLLSLGTNLESTIYSLVFQYNSIVLIFNAMTLFILFTRIHFQSNFVNYIASSCLAVYLVSNSPIFMGKWDKVVSMWIQGVTDSITWQVMFVFGFGLLVVAGFVLFDKLLTPIWKIVIVSANNIEKKTIIGKYLRDYK